jgi:DNA-binding transcriptional LysR family regulator
LVYAVFGRLPSLQALRAFEAAARRGSFKAAADELFVTPTAVSHQIRSLETRLGIALFERKVRGVELTAEGRALAPGLTRGFGELQSAIDDVLAEETVVTVSTTAAFAALRLVPELPTFYARTPGIRVRVETSTALVDLERDRRTDLAIRYGHGPWEGLAAIPLLDERFVALAAPGRFDADSIGADAPLLETHWQQPVLGDVNWRDWFGAAGEPAPASARIVTFDEELHVLQAAIAGHGIALASSVLAEDLVRRGLLEEIASAPSLGGARYTAVFVPGREEARRVRRFLDWLTGVFAPS